MREDDRFKIDKHKLIYHVSRVYQWLNGENVYPIYVEVGLNNSCNHRCIFCAEDAVDIISFTRKAGIDAAAATNGVMLDKADMDCLLSNLSWMRVSLDAGRKETYSIVHGTNESDFDLVIGNLKRAVKIRNKNKYPCIIGVQF